MAQNMATFHTVSVRVSRVSRVSRVRVGIFIVPRGAPGSKTCVPERCKHTWSVVVQSCVFSQRRHAGQSVGIITHTV